MAQETMAFLEIYKNGNLVKRRAVDNQAARQGVRFRYGSKGVVHLDVGETKHVGIYTFRLSLTDPEAAVQGDREMKQPQFSMDETVAAQYSSDPVPDIEGYRIIERVGQGGMGSVWRAEQLGAKREVALKVMLGARSFTQKAQVRFEREVAFTASMDHRNIARLYESGIHRGLYYYAMQFVDGISLDRYVEEQQLTPDQILTLAVKICRAVQYAHQRGVIHRDLKPSNIMVSPDGEPHIVDFGLARTSWIEDGDVTVSVEGEIAGTPAYMAPEQASGHHDLMDTRSDVFSLGVIFYGLLVGELPHDLSGTMIDVLQRIRQGQIRRPRALKPSLKPDIEAILLKAMALDMDERYSSAGNIAQDMTSYLEGDPVSAQGYTLGYVLRKKLRKHRLQISAACVFGLVLLGAGFYAYTKWVDHKEVLQELKAQELLVKLTQEDLSDAELNIVILGKDKDRARAALTILRDRYIDVQAQAAGLHKNEWKPPKDIRRVGLTPGPPLSPKSLVKQPPQLGKKKESEGSWTLETCAHRGPVVALTPCPDGHRMASVGADGTLRIWDTNQYDLSSILVPGAASLKQAAWLADGEHLLSCVDSPHAEMVLWDVGLRQRARSIRIAESEARCFGVSPDSTRLACYPQDANTIQIWNIQSKEILEPVKTIPVDSSALIHELAWSYDTRFLAAVHETGQLQVWNVDSNEVLYSQGDDQQHIKTVAWAPQGTELVVGISSGQENPTFVVELWQGDTGILIKRIPDSMSYPAQRFSLRFAWSPSGDSLAYVVEGVPVIWERETDIFKTLELNDISALTWLDKDSLALGDSLGSVSCVEINTGQVTQNWASAWCGSAQRTAFSPQGDRLAVLSETGVVSLWETRQWQPLAQWSVQPDLERTHTDNPVLLWSSTGNEVITHTGDGRGLMFYDSYSSRPTRSLRLPTGLLTKAALSPQGYLVAGTSHGQLCLWRSVHEIEPQILATDYGRVTALTWIAQGTQFVCANEDGTVRVWDQATLESTHDLKGPDCAIRSLISNPEGRTVTAHYTNGDLLTWDIQSGQSLIPIINKAVMMVVSPTGDYWAFGNSQGKIETRCVADPDKKSSLAFGTVQDLNWSPDGRFLLAAANDGTVGVWDVFNDFRGHAVLLPLQGRSTPGLAMTFEGDFRGPSGIARDLRYVVQTDHQQKTLTAIEFRNEFGWTNEPWQVGLFVPGDNQVQRIYVKADAQGALDGRTWETAFSDLQEALSSAQEGTEIWVAAGTYIPSRDDNPETRRYQSFRLKNGVRVYGGFAGHETNVNHRDWEVNPTVLSGDLDGNDQGFAHNDENSYHVVVADSIKKETVLDGFVITGGNANKPIPDPNKSDLDQTGGGMFIQYCTSDFNVVNCIFQQNSAMDRGGGLFKYASDAVIEGCLFTDNYSAKSGGGASLKSGGGTLRGCRFIKNRTKGSGGALYDGSYDSFIIDCEFSDNQAERVGGAAWCEYPSSFVNCLFYGNRANEGGAIKSGYRCRLKLLSCTFLGNEARGSGGAISCYNPWTFIENCEFIGNKARDTSGAINCLNADLDIVNSTFTQNKVTEGVSPGAINHYLPSGGKDPNNRATLYLTNSILWANVNKQGLHEGAQIQAINSEVNYCCIQKWTGRLGGEGNIGENPRFVDIRGEDGELGTRDDNVRLATDSPCIDKGDTSRLGMDEFDLDNDHDVNEVLPFDILGNNRVSGQGVDIGAYEVQQ
ncbi:protein kinase [Planctomycetota bacterium]